MNELLIPDIDTRRKICIEYTDNCNKCPLNFIWCFPDDYDEKSNVSKNYIQQSLFEELLNEKDNNCLFSCS